MAEDGLLSQTMALSNLHLFHEEDIKPTVPHRNPSGSTCSVWRTVLRADGRTLLAIRVVKVSTQRELRRANDGGARMRRTIGYFEREKEVWAPLFHRNVAPLLGWIEGFQGHELPGLVSEWYDNGDLMRYLRGNQASLHRKLELLHGVICGVSYLHSRPNPIVHRDIKAANVLIDDNGVARLCDFGLSKFLSAGGVAIMNSTQCNTEDWTPVEYCAMDDDVWHNPTTAGDMWSFACTILEVLRMKRPYHPFDALRRLCSIRPAPPRPAEEEIVIRDEHWELMQSCWDIDPSRRPTALQAAASLEQFVRWAASST